MIGSTARRLLARAPRLHALARRVKRTVVRPSARPPAGVVPLRHMRPPPVDEGNHPEALALLPYCVGRGIDVGCGHRKVAEHCIGVDLLAAGEVGEHGVMHGQRSVADIQASGDDLHMFADGELDFVVSRHNLEHYVDVVKTLQEWARVTRPGGTGGDDRPRRARRRHDLPRPDAQARLHAGEPRAADRRDRRPALRQGRGRHAELVVPGCGGEGRAD